MCVLCLWCVCVCGVHVCMCGVCVVCVCVCGLCHSPQETTHAPTTHPLLGRIFPLPLCLNLFLKGCLIEMFRQDSCSFACIFGDL